MFKRLEKYLIDMDNNLKEIKAKLAMPDSTTQILNSRFYLPNYPQDLIQNWIVRDRNYFEHDQLKVLDKYIKDNATILDIGANIGNHTLYWLNERNAKKVYSFEPVKSTFEILQKNIELNNLQEKTKLYNFGLSNEFVNGKISFYTMDNIGGTHIQKDPSGNLKLFSLDSLNIEEDSIDLIKIDVEGHEIEVLQGAINTLKKYKPIITIETFDKKAEVDTILGELYYKQIDTLTGADFVYATYY